MDIPLVSPAPLGSTAAISPITAAQALAAAEAQNAAVLSASLTTVDLSPLGRFLSASSLLQKKVLEQQVAAGKAEDAALVAPDPETIAASAVSLAGAFNELVANNLGATDADAGSTDGQSLAAQFAQRFGGETVPADDNATLANLDAIGLRFVPAPTQPQAQVLSVDQPALEAAVASDPAGTTALLGQAADAFSTLAGVTPQTVPEDSVEAPPVTPALQAESEAAQQAVASAAPAPDDVFLQQLINETARQPATPPPPAAEVFRSEAQFLNLPESAQAGQASASPAAALPADVAPAVAPAVAAPPAAPAATPPALPANNALAIEPEANVPVNRTLANETVRQPATPPTPAAEVLRNAPQAGQASTSPAAALPADVGPTVAPDVPAPPAAPAAAPPAAPANNALAINPEADALVNRTLADQALAARNATVAADERAQRQSDDERRELNTANDKHDAAMADAIRIGRQMAELRRERLADATATANREAAALAPDTTERVVRTEQVIPTTQAEEADTNVNALPPPAQPDRAQLAARDPAIAAAIAAYNLNTGPFSALNGKPEAGAPKARIVPPVATVTKVTAIDTEAGLHPGARQFT
jgi:hypothetical protein